MSAVQHHQKVRAYLGSHDVDASACEGSGVVGVEAAKVREALQ